MKNRTNLLSSLLIALIAGFIYFQLGSVENFKNIASLGFRIVSEPIEEITNTQLASNGIRINVVNKKVEYNSEFDENNLDIKRALKDLAIINDNGNIVRLAKDNTEIIRIPFYENSISSKEGEITFNPDYYVPLSNDNDVCLETIHVPDYEEYISESRPLVDYYEKVIPISYDDDPVTIIIDDSNCIKFKFDGIEMEGFNEKLNAAMQKLSLALEKLSDNLRDIDFNFHNKENKKEFELKMKEFESDMKEFELEMKEFGTEFEFDMEEFREDMIEFKEDMKEFKEEMKEYKEDMKEFKKEIEENEKEIKK